jgi:hypothetical protein
VLAGFTRFDAGGGTEATGGTGGAKVTTGGRAFLSGARLRWTRYTGNATIHRPSEPITHRAVELANLFSDQSRFDASTPSQIVLPRTNSNINPIKSPPPKDDVIVIIGQLHTSLT